MAYNTGFITSPVSIHDVQCALSTTDNDLGTLCRKPLINKWAKFKPVKVPKIQAINASDRVWCNYGIIDIPTWTRLSYMSIFLFSDSRGTLNSVYWPECDIEKGSLSLEYWEHQHPTGGVLSPYRLTDFQNYFHNAEEPIGPMQDNVINIDPTGTLRVNFKIGAQSNYTLKLSDLTWPGSSNYSIGNMYFGVLMKQVTGSITNRTYVATQKNGDGDITMSQAQQYGYWVDFSSTIVEAAFVGVWHIYPIISSIPIAETTSISQQDGFKFIAPLPFHGQDIAINIQYACIDILSANGYKDATSQQRYANVTLLLKNTEATARSYRAVVTLCDANGTELVGYTGGTQTGNIGASDQLTVTIQLYIAQIYSSTMYFKAEVTVSDNLKFKTASNWGITGPLQESSPTPDA